MAGAIAVIAFFTARDDATTSDDAILNEAPGLVASPPAPIAEVVERGNVVIEAPANERAALARLAREIAGDPYFTPELSRAGQAIDIRAQRGVQRIVAYAKQRRYVTVDPADPGLRQFVDYWLGGAA